MARPAKLLRPRRTNGTRCGRLAQSMDETSISEASRAQVLSNIAFIGGLLMFAGHGAGP